MYLLIILLLALAVYGIFTVLRRATSISPQNEIDTAREADHRRSTQEREWRIDSRSSTSSGVDNEALPTHAEAMILPLGAPIEREHATFEGSLSEARERIRSMSSAERDHIAIWSPGHIFTADQLLAEGLGHEHDPLPPLAGSASAT